MSAAKGKETTTYTYFPIADIYSFLHMVACINHQLFIKTCFKIPCNKFHCLILCVKIHCELTTHNFLAKDYFKTVVYQNFHANYKNRFSQYS